MQSYYNKHYYLKIKTKKNFRLKERNASKSKDTL